MNIKPLLDRILVPRLEGGAQHVGDIITPDTAEEKPKRGIVLAFDRGKMNDGGERKDDVLAAIDAAFAAKGGC